MTRSSLSITSPWGLVRVLVLLIYGAAAFCTYPVAPPDTPSAALGDPCKSMTAVLRGGSTARCTAAQRVCLLVTDVPVAVGSADFLPDISYAARWRPHVRAWRLELGELAKESALETYVHVMQRKLDLLDGSEHDRRLIGDSGDLLHALQVLTEKATRVLADPGLGCTLFEEHP